MTFTDDLQTHGHSMPDLRMFTTMDIQSYFNQCWNHGLSDGLVDN